MAYCLALVLLGLAVYQIPAVKTRLEWRLDAAVSFVRGVMYSPERAPTPLPPPPTATVLASPTPSATPTSLPTPTPGPTATPIPSPTPLPAQVLIDPPAWEKQDWNNCGPATLSLYLRWFGWEGDQFTISSLIKPKRRDRNVNVEELVWYARNHAGWLNTEFRVGGDIDLLKRYLALGMPIMIEEGTLLDQAYWPTDDKWAGHYLLLTGYDDATQTFVAQDTYKGADLRVSYTQLDENWKAFNRVYIMIYPPQREAEVQALLGEDWDVDVNRQHALDQARAETEANSEDAFAWFNLGSNLVYFEKYQDAALAYDTARQLGLPQRMFRYQFGPFLAYFHAFRLDDLMALTEYALKLTANSEEAMLWRGWGFYRLGERQQALEMFYQALEANPNYQDARYAIDFVLNN
ncbi:MAG: hypothetical protein D6803_03565 [Anaerolineae bacterium]|nr:MAG: hypothetical protein D6803_03565 [Anaerolineae bacterium]